MRINKGTGMSTRRNAYLFLLGIVLVTVLGSAALLTIAPSRQPTLAPSTIHTDAPAPTQWVIVITLTRNNDPRVATHPFYKIPAATITAHYATVYKDMETELAKPTSTPTQPTRTLNPIYALTFTRSAQILAEHDATTAILITQTSNARQTGTATMQSTQRRK